MTHPWVLFPYTARSPPPVPRRSREYTGGAGQGGGYGGGYGGEGVREVYGGSTKGRYRVKGWREPKKNWWGSACGPLLIVPPALKRWGTPRRQGLCSHLAHLWATSDSATRSEAVGTPQTAGVM